MRETTPCGDDAPVTVQDTGPSRAAGGPGAADSLDRRDGIALWRQVAGALEDAIRAGRHAAGERLPTEAALAAHFGVNRHTVRRAIAELEASGLVRAEQGRGTFVRADVIDYPIGRRVRFRETLERQARDPDRELLGAEVVAAARAVSAALGIPPGARVELIELVGKADGRRISLSSHYFPRARFAGIGERWAEVRSVTGALAAFGIEDYTRRGTRVTARPADAREQRLLDLPRHRPLLITESVNVDAAGRVIEYGVARFAADRVQLVFGE